MIRIPFATENRYMYNVGLVTSTFISRDNILAIG